MLENHIDRKYGDSFYEKTFEEQRVEFSKVGYFIGEYTFEIDIFNCSSAEDKKTGSSTN